MTGTFWSLLFSSIVFVFFVFYRWCWVGSYSNIFFSLFLFLLLLPLPCLIFQRASMFCLTGSSRWWFWPGWLQWTVAVLDCVVHDSSLDSHRAPGILHVQFAFFFFVSWGVKICANFILGSSWTKHFVCAVFDFLLDWNWFANFVGCIYFVSKIICFLCLIWLCYNCFLYFLTNFIHFAWFLARKNLLCFNRSCVLGPVRVFDTTVELLTQLRQRPPVTHVLFLQPAGGQRGGGRRRGPEPRRRPSPQRRQRQHHHHRGRQQQRPGGRRQPAAHVPAAVLPQRQHGARGHHPGLQRGRPARRGHGGDPWCQLPVSPAYTAALALRNKTPSFFFFFFFWGWEVWESVWLCVCMFCLGCACASCRRFGPVVGEGDWDENGGWWTSVWLVKVAK